eukprot:g50436.t1
MSEIFALACLAIIVLQSKLGIICYPQINFECLRDMRSTVLSEEERDDRGCLPSAGYTWCEQEQQCVRPWTLESDHPCYQRQEKQQSTDSAASERKSK